MTAERLDGIRACVFDAYGTLFDVHSAVARLEDRIGPDAARLSQLWRTKQLEYTWLRALMGAHADFWQVTGEALDYAVEASGIEPGAIRDPLMDAYRTLDPYPEVPEVLTALREAGLKTAILSNGEPGMLHAATESAGIASALDAVLSVEDVGVYKPHPKVYQLVLDSLGVDSGEVAFQSSNGWDVHGAATFGFNAVWINRGGAPRERLPGTPARVLTDLRPLPALVGTRG